MARYLVAQNPGPAGPPRPDPDFGYDVWDTHRGDELVVCDGFRVVRHDLGAWRHAR